MELPWCTYRASFGDSGPPCTFPLSASIIKAVPHHHGHHHSFPLSHSYFSLSLFLHCAPSFDLQREALENAPRLARHEQREQRRLRHGLRIRRRRRRRVRHIRRLRKRRNRDRSRRRVRNTLQCLVTVIGDVVVRWMLSLPLFFLIFFISFTSCVV